MSFRKCRYYTTSVHWFGKVSSIWQISRQIKTFLAILKLSLGYAAKHCSNVTQLSPYIAHLKFIIAYAKIAYFS